MSYSLNVSPVFEILALRDSKREVSFPVMEIKPVTNVYFTHSGLALSRYKPIEETFFNNISAKRKKSLVRYARIKKLTEKKIRGKKNAAFIHHIWSNGYHHWVCECLLKATYLNPKEDIIYLPEEYPHFAFESLALMGFQNIIKIPKKTGVRCTEAKLVPNPTSGHFLKTHLIRIRESLNHLITKVQHNSNEKIFISRKKAGLRKIDNEDELITILLRFGYTLIFAEDLSLKEQIAIFSNCKILISIHGAGLTNCLFMPENSFVFEIYRKMESETDVMNLCYYRMAKALQHNYIIQFADVVESYKNTTIDRQDIHVDIPEFERNLKLIETNLNPDA